MQKKTISALLTLATAANLTDEQRELARLAANEGESDRRAIKQQRKREQWPQKYITDIVSADGHDPDENDAPRDAYESADCEIQETPSDWLSALGDAAEKLHERRAAFAEGLYGLSGLEDAGALDMDELPSYIQDIINAFFDDVDFERVAEEVYDDPADAIATAALDDMDSAETLLERVEDGTYKADDAPQGWSASEKTCALAGWLAAHWLVSGDESGAAEWRDEIEARLTERANALDIDDIAREIEAAKAEIPDADPDAEDLEDEPSLDIRLVLRPDGSWEVLTGDPQYDTDHRGLWASGTLGRSDDAAEVAADLIRQIEDQREDSCDAPSWGLVLAYLDKYADEQTTPAAYIKRAPLTPARIMSDRFKKSEPLQKWLKSKMHHEVKAAEPRLRELAEAGDLSALAEILRRAQRSR